jgi:hypothetical protein
MNTTKPSSALRSPPPPSSREDETSLPVPILASTLLECQDEQRDQWRRWGWDSRLRTGCEGFDVQVLGGGVRGGEVIGLSGEENVRGLVSLRTFLSCR